MVFRADSTKLASSPSTDSVTLSFPTFPTFPALGVSGVFPVALYVQRRPGTHTEAEWCGPIVSRLGSANSGTDVSTCHLAPLAASDTALGATRDGRTPAALDAVPEKST